MTSNDPGIYDPDLDRDRGILTPHDRRFLLDGMENADTGVREEMKPGAIRQKRYKIRNRFQNAIADMQYLPLSADGLDDVFSEERWDLWGDYQEGGVHGSFVFSFYVICRKMMGWERFLNSLERFVETDVRQDYYDENVYLPQDSLRINVEYPDPEECPTLGELVNRLEQGEEIEWQAHRLLERAGLHPNPDEIPPRPSLADESEE